SITSNAQKTEAGWLLNGQKVWTTNAQHSHYMIALVRTGDKEESGRHGGMSQFIIDLSLPGVTIRPIADLSGNEHFNEVFFESDHDDNDALIGAEGNGCGQKNAEQAFERSGPEHLLSSIALMHTAYAAIGKQPDALQARDIVRITA